MDIMFPRREDIDTDPHRRAVLALSILQHREHTKATIELAVMALRGATFPDLLAADKQMAGA